MKLAEGSADETLRLAGKDWNAKAADVAEYVESQSIECATGNWGCTHRKAIFTPKSGGGHTDGITFPSVPVKPSEGKECAL